MDNRMIALATQTKYPDPNCVRAKLALSTITNARSANYRIAVSEGSGGVFYENAIRSGAFVSEQIRGRSMGADRRDIMQIASQEMIDKDGVIVWLEPEKDTLIDDIGQIAQPILDGRADMVIPARSSFGWSSYPKEQKHIEKFGNMGFSAFTRMSLDIWFGPFAVNKNALQFFLDYDGEYGDLWDSIHIPRVRVIAAGLKVLSVVCPNFRYPPEQRKEEEGNPALILKRVDQISNLVRAFHSESLKLGLIK